MKHYLGAALLASLCYSCQTPKKATSDQLYDQAVSLIHQGRFAAAEPLLYRVIELAPDSTIARVRLGETQIRLGRQKRATQILDALPAAIRNRPETRVLEARLLAFAGFAHEAEFVVNQVLDEYPSSLEGRLLLAELYLQAAATMNLERASALCSQALEGQPEHRDALHLLLQATLRLGRFEAALERSQTLVEAYPDQSEAQLLAGTAALWANDEQAFPWLKRAVDLALDHPTERLTALWLLKVAYDRRGGYPPSLAPRYRFHTYTPPTPKVDLHFTDITSQAGVGKKDRGRGSAWLDFDLDGDLDLFSVGIQVEHALYRNDGGDRFSEITREAGLADPRGGWATSAADFDNDGDDDLFTTRDAWEGENPNSLYRNDLGTFHDIAKHAGIADSADSFTATWLDFDLDGYLDLYVANGVSGSGRENTLLHNQKNGTFLDKGARAAVADSSKTIGTAAGDIDGDGFPDLYAVNIGEINRLYRNKGDGTFSDLAEQAGVLFPIEGGYVALFLDLDNDGELDLFVSTMSAFADVLNSQVTGRAIEPNRPFLYRNMGDGTFSDITLHAGLARSFGTMGAGAGDVDNDGFIDIYLANGGPQMARLEPNILYRNMGDDTFSDITARSGTGSLGKGHGATFADFDQDGDLDIYAGLGGHYDADIWSNVLYRNDSPAVHYLEIELVGTRSNRNGIGTRVTAFTADRQIHAVRQSGFGFGTSNGPALHLGLGSATHIDSLRLIWPSGDQEHLLDVPANCTIRVTEGDPHYHILRRRP